MLWVSEESDSLKELKDPLYEAECGRYDQGTAGEGQASGGRQRTV